FGRPSPETFHRRQTFNDRIVRQRVQLLELQTTVDNPPAQITQVADFLAAQPDRSEYVVAHAIDCDGIQRLPFWKEPCEALKDRRSRFRRELLTDNGPDERGEVILALARGQATRTDALDGRTEHRIAAAQQSSRALVIRRRQLRMIHRKGSDAERTD